MVISAAEPAEVRQLLISRLKVRFLPRSPSFQSLASYRKPQRDLAWIADQDLGDMRLEQVV